jgi:Spy/CpxP family protein refolding chaperone
LDEKKLDASKIEKKVKEIESLKSELLMGRIRSLIEAADFLSPEQFAQFRAMTMQRMNPMGHLQKHSMGPHGGTGMTPGMMMPHQ